ncbi:MAG: beta-aspartyl-peptidase [Firmicutes bacterium HGW-Firmicutes-14]|nr:MAG: beta-aspartyl-peptidase [Firmicutes bacterium HGW-Firmicutes-14]
MFKLIKNGTVFGPECLGRKDILIAGEKIAFLQDNCDHYSSLPGIDIIDAADNLVVPGFIDWHVHISGGGGEGGPATRTPEIQLSNLTTAGITTVVGLLGTDGITRSMAGLLAKARALEDEGLTAYIYTGAYQIPTRTLTGNIRSDMVLIEKVVGVGEIAVSDHRSSQPTREMLAKLASEARTGGLLGKKAGLVHLHIGEGKQGLNPVFDVVSNTDIPITQFVPTHVNRLWGLLEEAAYFIRQGGNADLTAGIYPDSMSTGAVEVSRAVEYLVSTGTDLGKVTVSSDANGSLPVFDSLGNLTDIQIGSAGILWDDLKQVVSKGILPLQQAVSLITLNVARKLDFIPRKGTIKAGSDADLVLLDCDLNIDKVLARGRLMVNNGSAVVLGYFES